MEKQDVVLAFQNELNEVEKRFFDDYNGRKESLKKKFGDRFLYDESVIMFPFNYEFFIKGHKCKIKFAGEIRVIE